MGQSGPSRNYPDTARLLLRPVNENLAFDDKGLRLCANAGVDADQCAGSDPVVGITCPSPLGTEDVASHLRD
jgi:hypothetical protein